MPLQRGKVLGYDFNRMVVDFTMFNQGKTVRCAISRWCWDPPISSSSHLVPAAAISSAVLQ